MRRFDPVGSLPAILAASLLGLVLAGASAARPPFGGHGGHRGGPGPGGFLDHHADRLGLDAETREAIRAIVEESREEAEERHAELRERYEQMRELLSADAPDKAAVMAQAEAIGAVEIQLHKHRLATLLEIRPLLTPEQREELKQMREGHRSRRRHPAMEGCDADVARFCPEAEDRWSRRHCLREHRESLSEPCRDAVESVLKDLRPRRFEDGER